MEIIAQHQTLFLALALACGLYMTWGIGANDVANAMGEEPFKEALIPLTSIRAFMDVSR